MEAPLSKQTPQTLRQVVATKVGAVENFHNSAAALPLDFSLLCSSVSSVAGYSGHANYAAANAALDAFAIQQAGVGGSTLSVQWGAWSAVGTCNRLLYLCLIKKTVYVNGVRMVLQNLPCYDIITNWNQLTKH